MAAVFIPFRKGPSDRPASPRAVGVLASFADEKSCRHPDFTVTEIGDHRDNVVTETGDHPDFGRTPTFRSAALRSASAPFTAPSLKAGSLRPANFCREYSDLTAMRGVAAPPAPGQPDPERPPFLRGAGPEKPPDAGQNRTERTENRTKTGQDPDRNRTAPGQQPDGKAARPRGS
jgi:hypothetical protein